VGCLLALGMDATAMIMVHERDVCGGTTSAVVVDGEY
jgi:hypothetical protein